MSGQQPPLTCKEIKKILRHLGFEPSKRTGTSHEKWRKTVGTQRYVVTVDCPKAPFSQILIKSMAEQAGKKKKDFYNILKTIS